MLIAIASKVIFTALFIVFVTTGASRLGPRFGGILAGAPVVLGPAYFFILQKNDDIFVSLAALSSMNTLTATIVFTTIYLSVASQLTIFISLIISSLGWLATVLILFSIPKSIFLSTILFFLSFFIAKTISFKSNFEFQETVIRKNQFDTVAKAIAAGFLVGVSTTLSDFFGPDVSGAIVGFPIGFTAIVITLHGRYGYQISRATVASAQTGMLSIFLFILALTYYSETIGRFNAFVIALIISLLATSIFIIIDRLRNV